MGKLVFKRGLLVKGSDIPYTLPAATTTVRGGVKQVAVIADSVQVSYPTVTEYNALLAALRTAGILASS